MNDWKIFEGDISDVLYAGLFPVAYFCEDPSGVHYCIVTANDDKTPGQLAMEFMAMKDRLAMFEEDKKQGVLF